jgi:HEAT repeat protein
MELAHAAQVMPAVDQLLQRAHEFGPDVIAPCLRLIGDPRKAHWARTFAVHDCWYVRVCAANALRRIGGAQDRALLQGLLCDAHWWVRHRAAQALISLPVASLDDWEQIAAAHADRYAGEMLRHVIAEARLA